MPRPVRTYIPSSRLSSTQLTPRPHRRVTAATRPRKGVMTATRYATRRPNEALPGPASAAGLEAGRGGNAVNVSVPQEQRCRAADRKKSRHGGIPSGTRPRRLTLQQAPRHGRVASHLVIRLLQRLTGVIRWERLHYL